MQTIVTESDCLVGGKGRSRREGLEKGTRRLWVVMGMLIIIMIVVMVSQVWMYVKAGQVMHCKYANYIGCQLHTNKAVFKIFARKWSPIPHPVFPTSLSSFLLLKGDHTQFCS